MANELRIRAAQQAAIARLSQQALARVDFSDLLNNTTALIAGTFAVDYSAIMRLLPDRQSIQLAAGTGWLPGTKQIVFSAGANSLSGYTLMSKEPVIIDDMRTDERFRALELFQRHRVVSGISVVIGSKDAGWGSLAAFSTKHRSFSLDDINFLQALANLLAEADHRLKVESALAQQAALLDKANDAIIVWGLDNRIRFWNKGAERLFGWARDEVIECFEQDILRDFAIAYEKAIEQLLTSGEWRGIARHRRKDGSELTVQENWTLILDNENKPESVFSILTDITKELALEEQLKQSQRLEAVGELTGGIAHDFNNLLTIVRGNSELLIEQLEGNDDLRRLADMVLSAAKRGADLTHRLLAFARRQPLAPKVVDINNLVGEFAPLLRRAVSADIEVELLKADNLWFSLIDPSQLQAAILNLCINARDAMPKGGKISIETANRYFTEKSFGDNGDDNGSSGKFVMVSVSDAGVGIPKETVGRVFDPFFTTKDVGKGTGLGLSMVYGFIKQSRGHISIDSEVGKGTTIRMFLPRSNEVLPFHDDVEISISGLGGSELILIVEDDELVRSQAERQLVSLGYRVTTAPDGPTALGIISRRDDIDLLFTDIIMPGGINGRVLANKSVNLRPGLKVLYTSGYTDDILSQDGHMDDGTVLLSKPYSRFELAQKVRQSLNAVAPLS